MDRDVKFVSNSLLVNILVFQGYYPTNKHTILRYVPISSRLLNEISIFVLLRSQEGAALDSRVGEMLPILPNTFLYAYY